MQLGFILINESTITDPQFGGELTAPILQQIADALDAYANEDLAPVLGGGFLVKTGTLTDATGPNTCAVRYVDSLAQVPGAAAYHDRTATGAPIIWVARNEFDSFADGARPLSEGTGHEIAEAAKDPGANLWADRPDGTEEAEEECLAPETDVLLADGKRVSIATLAERGGFFEVITAYGVARAGHARLTGRDRETVRVTFTDGSSIRCTPDHPLMLSDGSFCRADLLVPATRLRAVVQMAPSMSVTGALNGADGEAESSGSVLASFIRSAELNHDLVGEYRLAAGFSEQVTVSDHPAFCSRVQHVVFMRPKKEMIGTHTQPDVASMANKKSIRYRSEMKFVRQAVRKDTFLSDRELSITLRVLCTGPEPARSSLANARAQARLERRRSGVVRHEAGVGSTVMAPALVMRAAQPARPRSSDASIDGTAPYRTVLSVQSDGRTDVFDLTVPHLRHFAISPGIFAHNCDRLQGSRYTKSGVTVPDFLLASAWQPGASRPYSKLDALVNQYDVTPEGYVILRQQGALIQPTQERGEHRIVLAKTVSVHGTGLDKLLNPTTVHEQAKLARKRHPISRTWARGVRL